MTNVQGSSHGPDFSRRQVLQYTGVAAAAVGGTSLLAACGGGGSGSGGGSGGTLIHGATGGSNKDTLDPHRPVQAADISRTCNLYEPLLQWDDNYEIAPSVAESVEPSADAKTWTIKIRDGITFHNGKQVTPEDVLFTINRVAGGGDPKKATSAGGLLSTIVDFSATKKVDDKTVSLVLKTPYALLNYLLAEYTLGVIPKDFDLAKPVGTGPFKFKDFTPGKSSTFTRYADYWGDKAKVEELKIQDFADSKAQLNALLAGQIQTLDNLDYSLIKQVEKQAKTLSAESGAWVPFTMRVDQKPFSDVRVRQALRLICDRQQMIDQALSGNGTLGNDLYAPFDPAYNKDLPQRSQDIEQAKSLLKSAGQSGLQVELFTGDDIGAVAPATAALFQQQAKKAGVDVKVVKKNPFYGDDYLKYSFAQDFWNTRTYIAQAAVSSLKGGTYNETHFDNKKFAGLISQAQATVDEAKRNQLLADAQEIEYNEGGYIIWGFRKQIDAYASNVSGLKPSKYLPLGRYNFSRASVG